MRFLKADTAFTFRAGPFVDSTDGVTAETGLTIAQADIQISKDGGAFAQTSATTPTTTHDADGWYQCPLTTTDTNTEGPLTVQIAMSGALPVWEHFMVVPANVYDSLVDGADNLQVDTIQIGGTTQTANDVGADVDAILVDTAEIGAAGAGLTEAGGTGDQLTAVPYNAAWDAEIQSEVTDALNAYDPPTNAEMEARTLAAAAYFDPATDTVDVGAINGSTAAATLLEDQLSAYETGTAQAGAAGTITLAASGPSATNDYYNGQFVWVLSGTGAGQVRQITDYVGSTKVATVEPNWATTPSTDSVYLVIPVAAAPDSTLPEVNVTQVSGAAEDLPTATALAVVDGNVDSILTDTGTTLPATLATIDGNVDSILTDTGTTIPATLSDMSGATFDTATDSLEAIRNRGDAAWTTGAGGTPPQLLQNTTIATLASQTSFTLTAGSADDDAYNDAIVIVTDQSTSTQKAVGRVLDYTGSTRTVTLAADPGIFTMATGDTVDIIASTAGLTESDVRSAVGLASANLDTQLAALPTAVENRAEMDSNSTQLAAIVADTNELQTDDVPGLIAALNDPTLAAIADAVWDEVLTGATHNVSTSAGRRLRELAAASIRAGTAQAGSGNSITLDSGASSTDEIYDNNLVVITAGTGAGQSRIIVEYNGTTKVAIVDQAWETNPDATSEFQILADQQIQTTHHGIAQAGAAGTITLSASASSQDDIYNDQMIAIRTSTGTGQVRRITDYDGTTKVASIAPDWNINPTSASVYAILPAVRVDVGAIGGETATATAAVDFDDIATIESRTATILTQRAVPAQGVAFTFSFKMVDATDFATPETGLTVTATRSLDGAAFGSATGTVTEIGNGMYEMAASAADMNAGVVVFRFTASGAAASEVEVITDGGV